ncbi:MAG: hypothetical protein JXQ29_14665 [Planctomycetes bacterium]|nr:hypothetical protein [Planctomycetota bacterium]
MAECGDRRFVNLSYDGLLVISITGSLPGVFQEYSGFLAASGKATAANALPNVPAPCRNPGLHRIRDHQGRPAVQPQDHLQLVPVHDSAVTHVA